MWKTNFKQALRYIINQKTYSLIIIIGLSVGLAASFLIYSYVHYEKSYDSFYENGKDLYRINVISKTYNEDPYKSPYSYAPQGPVALKEIPEVENYVRLFRFPSVVISPENSASDIMLTENEYYYADETFFELFTFPLLRGDAKTVLKESGSAVISKSLSTKLFGSQNPVGELLKVDGQYNMKITGVFEDIPENTHLKFNMLFSLNTFPWIMNEGNAWNSHSFFTYVSLKKDSDPRIVEQKLTTAYSKENRAVNQSDCVWNLQPVNEAYLSTADFTSKPKAFKFGDARMVYFLKIVALLILCIAWINYINLTTTKAIERTKEIGVRKSNGASKIQLIRQFFTESFIYNITSILIASIIVFVIFQWFTHTMSISSSLTKMPGFWIVISSVLIIGIALPGSITAFSASSISPFKPSFVRGRSNQKTVFRNGMVVFQFVIIIALLVGTVIVNKQLKYIQNIDLGFNKEQVLVLNAPRVDINNDKLENNLSVLREELKKQANIYDVTASVSIPGERFGSGNGGPSIIGSEDQNTYFRVGRVMPNYLDFFGIDLAAGENFPKTNKGNNKSIIITEEAVKEFGLKDADEAVQKKVFWNGNEVTIIGVTKSFHQQSLHIIPEPMIIYTMLHENNYNYIMVKLETNDLTKTIETIKDEYAALFPNNPFDFFFLDSYFDLQYKKDLAFQKLFSFFSIIAVIIGLIGLYGLTVFRILKRTKEIGVHKVNGARTSEVMMLLNIDFVKWIGLALIIATPLSWYAMKNWLENFAYRTEISWWTFALAGSIALVIALITVSWQSWKAANRNPVEALRYE